MKIRQQIAVLMITAGLAGAAFAAGNATPAPVETDAPVVYQRAIDEAEISMSDAIRTAQKAHGGEATRATLRRTQDYGLVWDVRIVKTTKGKEDATRIRTLIDAKTGKVLATDVNEIQRSGFRGYHGHRGYHGRDCCDENRGYNGTNGEGRQNR